MQKLLEAQAVRTAQHLLHTSCLPEVFCHRVVRNGSLGRRNGAEDDDELAVGEKGGEMPKMGDWEEWRNAKTGEWGK